MSNLSRFLRFTTVIFLFLLAGHALAQDATPSDALPLTLNETVTGQLSGAGDRVTYRFEMPPDGDVVVAYSADRVVMAVYCVRLTSAVGEDRECEQGSGGGGGDLPISHVFVIPAADQPDTVQTIELTLSRPLRETTDYELTVYPVTPESLTLDTDLNVEYDGSLPYHVYALEVDPTRPFTLEIEDAARDGNFLWVAHQPFLDEPLPDERLWFLHPIDNAIREPDGEGIERLYLYALGGISFRVLVVADGDYSLNTAAMDVQPLEEQVTHTVIVSYREPVNVVRLEGIEPGEVATVHFRVVTGTAALVRVYSEGNPVGDALALGESSVTGSQFPLTGTLDWTAEADRAVYAMIQIPFEFTRSALRAEVWWER